MTLRLTSSSFAGMLRKLVAVGTSRLADMFLTIAAPTPLISSPGCSSSGFGAGRAGVAGAAVGDGARRLRAQAPEPTERAHPPEPAV